MSEVYYNIKVYNFVTSGLYYHRNVPSSHVEGIRLNPNLEVEIIEVSIRRNR